MTDDKSATRDEPPAGSEQKQATQQPASETVAQGTERRAVVQERTTGDDNGRQHDGQKRSDDDGWRLLKTHQVLTVLFSGAVAAAGWFSYLAARDQWETMKGQLETANRQAAAAEKANQVSEDALRLARRPWVGLDRIEIVKIRNAIPTTIKIVIKNSGQGPAINASFKIDTKILPVATPPHQPDRPCATCGTCVMLPGGEATANQAYSDTQLTDRDLEFVKNGDLIFWMIGWIEYSDEFGGRHLTEICARYSAPSHTFRACETGNSAN